MAAPSFRRLTWLRDRAKRFSLGICLWPLDRGRSIEAKEMTLDEARRVASKKKKKKHTKQTNIAKLQEMLSEGEFKPFDGASRDELGHGNRGTGASLKGEILTFPVKSWIMPKRTSLWMAPMARTAYGCSLRCPGSARTRKGRFEILICASLLQRSVDEMQSYLPSYSFIGPCRQSRRKLIPDFFRH